MTTEDAKISESVDISEQTASWRTWAWFFVLAVVAITCVAGFFPRGSFSQNWVDWDAVNGRTQIGKYGLAYGDFPEVSRLNDGSHSLMIRFNIVPEAFQDSSFRFLVHIGTRDDQQPFIIGQWRTQLIVMQGNDFTGKLELPRLIWDLRDHVGANVELALSLHSARNLLYANGVTVASHNPSTFELEKEAAHISIGNSPEGKHGWSGAITTFIIERVSVVDGRVEVLRKYNFTENKLPQVVDVSANAAHLTVPRVGSFPKKSMLDALSIDFLLSHNLRDTVINFVGFAPLGFAICLFLFLIFPSAGFLKIGVVAVVLGVLFSLVIEVTQQIIPGRNSHLHDLVLNSAGALFGVFGFWMICGLIALIRRFGQRRASRLDM